MQALGGDGETVYSQEYADHHKRLQVDVVFRDEDRILRRHEEDYEVYEALQVRMRSLRPSDFRTGDARCRRDIVSFVWPLTPFKRPENPRLLLFIAS